VGEATVNDGYSVTTGAQFLRWWKAHLWQCVPSGLRASAMKSARPMMISLTDDAIWPERGDLAKPLRISQTTFLSGNAEKTRPVALVIGEGNGLRRKVELPLAVEERLGQVLAYELDRLTPLRAEELYYDFRLLSRNATRGVCVVELMAAPKVRVNEMIAMAKAKGASVNRLLLAPSDVDNGVDLLKTAQRGDETAPGNRWITPALFALCVLLALALIAYPIYKKRQHVIDLLPIESSARADAEAASIVQRQLDKLVTEYNHLLKRKHASPIAVQILEDMGKRLPDDTWAQTFEIKPVANAPVGQHPREVIVQGETGSGGKLLQLVQESTLLKDPVLKAAMTRVSPTAERFHFAGELVAVAPPPGLTLSDTSAVLGTPIQVTPNNPAGAPATVVPPVSPAGAATKPVATDSVTPTSPKSPAPQLPAPSPKEMGAPADASKKSTTALTVPYAPGDGARQIEAAIPAPQSERRP
jgi:general secretion pathway protein L